MTNAPPPSEPLVTRILLVLSAQCVFTILVTAVLAAPPSFLTVVAFGSVLGLAIEYRALRTGTS